MSTTSVHINVTNKCNLRCSYCYYFDDEINISDREPDYNTLISYIKQAEEINAKLIILSGGEAFLREDIFDLLEYGNTPKMLLTNAILLDKNKIEKLNNIHTLKDVKISFDGFIGHDINRGKGTSELVRQKLKLVDAYGNFPYTINTVVSIDNYKELLDIYDLILDSACYRWEVDFPVLRGRAKKFHSFEDEEESLYKEILVPLIKKYFDDGCQFKMNILGTMRWEFTENNLNPDFDEFQFYTCKEHPCQYAIDSFTIQTSGDVSFCPSLPIVFGNADTNTLMQILESKKYREFAKITVNDIENCINCRYIHLCGGGCRADALDINKKMNAHDPLSCTRMINFEKHILPEFPITIQNNINNLIDKNGQIPIGGKQNER